jgi:cytochrome b6-f complex iron-sulfur subunit|nr:Rieske (2Fe-2S) protein [uncultured Flavobacterium sp.]
MNRKEFFAKVGFGAATVLLPACIAGLATSCSSNNEENTTAPTAVDFIIDISTGSLAADGGFLVSKNIVVARVDATTFLAVSAACTHEGTNVNYVSASKTFHCPNHGANFSSTGNHLNGPGNGNLKQYNVALSGNSLRIYS